MSLSELVIEAKGFESILKAEDYSEIEDIHRQLKNISLIKEKYNDKHTQEFLELIIKFKNLLEKGDYAI